MSEIRQESFGQKKLTLIDHLGVKLSYRRILKELSNFSSPLVALDIGCGYNADLIQLILPKLSLGVGVDIKINESLKSKIPNVQFIESSIEQALSGFHDNKFDMILMISVLEHLFQPEEVLKKCYNILRIGGAMLINVPTWRGKKALEFSAFKLGFSPAVEMDDHKMYYNLRDLWPLLVRAGFKPSKIKIHNYKLGLNLFSTSYK